MQNRKFTREEFEEVKALIKKELEGYNFRFNNGKIGIVPGLIWDYCLSLRHADIILVVLHKFGADVRAHTQELDVMEQSGALEVSPQVFSLVKMKVK